MEKKINSYAEALFMISEEENSTEEYLKALYDICAVFKENPEYPLLLSSYSISKEKRIKAIEEAFGNTLPEKVVSFMCILCQKRKADDIDEITAEFENMYFSKENISRAVITSAYPLDEDQREKIGKKLEKLCSHRIVSQYKTEKNLLGGIKIELDGKIIDSSVRNQLNKLREVMDK